MEKLKVKLIGTDGNAIAIIGKVSREMKKAGFDKETIHKYTKEAMSGNYNHLLQVTMKWVDIE